MKCIGCINLSLSILLITTVGCLKRSETSPDDVAIKSADMIRVNCVIEFNGRRERIESEVELESQKANAFEALRTLAQQQGLEIESRGDGESRFVVSVDGFANEGAGGKNWVYKVDGKLGDRSSGIFDVTQGQQIQWSLGVYP